jgi:hypothetical protein
LFTLDAIAFQRMLNRIQEILIAKWLGQELNRSGFHRPDRHGDVAMSCNKDDGRVAGRRGQLPLKIETAFPGNLISSTRQTGPSAGGRF